MPGPSVATRPDAASCASRGRLPSLILEKRAAFGLADEPGAWRYVLTKIKVPALTNAISAVCRPTRPFRPFAPTAGSP